jgi:hypothetical protein
MHARTDAYTHEATLPHSAFSCACHSGVMDAATAPPPVTPGHPYRPFAAVTAPPRHEPPPTALLHGPEHALALSRDIAQRSPHWYGVDG